MKTSLLPCLLSIALLTSFCSNISDRGGITVDPVLNEVEVVSQTVEDIYDSASIWVDSVYMSLSEDERIAQLFWVTLEKADDEASYQKIMQLTINHQPGGILFLRVSAHRAYEAVQDLQSQVSVPLLFSIDGENGPAMRINGVVEFPDAMALGAIRNDSLVYCMGREIARQLKLLGIHVNFAPVADVNSNPNNPVIGVRSFGELPHNVAAKAVAYMKGLQDGGVMAVGKHFPGHGDTGADSHHTLPLVDHNRERLDSCDLLTFKSLIDAGIWGIMTAHIDVPALTDTTGLPSSFSHKIVGDLLKGELGFKGLIITDAVNMQGAKVMGKPGQVDALALAAGNDIVEFTENLPAAMQAVKQALADSMIAQVDLEAKVRRSLAFKYWLTRAEQVEPIETDSLLHYINTPEAEELNRALYGAALTGLVNKLDRPLNEVFMGPSSRNATSALSETASGDLSESTSGVSFSSASKSLSGTSVTLSSVNISSSYAAVFAGESPVLEGYFKDKGIDVVKLNGTAADPVLKQALKYKAHILVISDAQKVDASVMARLNEAGSTMVLYMGNPYRFSRAKGAKDADVILVAYKNNHWAQEAVIGFLEGVIEADGILPVSIEGFPAGTGIRFDFKE